ncbi:MAG: hypothetical protein WA978_00415 [Sphingopyxis granuli]|uniref:hypothetical protein n=1 Tax=Sphingopyxis granuli TaxID=267128 RepID=UPI003C78F08B
MNKFSKLCIAALAASSMVTPAFAQQIDAGKTLYLEGGAVLVKGITSSCTLELDISTDPSGTGLTSTGTLNSGSNSGAGICPGLTIDPTTFSLISYDPTGNGSAIGRLDDLVVRLSGVPICAYDPALDPFPDFLIENLNASPAKGVEVTFGVSGPVKISGTVPAPGDCTADASLLERDLPEVLRVVP